MAPLLTTTHRFLLTQSEAHPPPCCRSGSASLQPVPPARPQAQPPPLRARPLLLPLHPRPCHRQPLPEGQLRPPPGTEVSLARRRPGTSQRGEMRSVLGVRPRGGVAHRAARCWPLAASPCTAGRQREPQGCPMAPGRQGGKAGRELGGNARRMAGGAGLPPSAHTAGSRSLERP